MMYVVYLLPNLLRSKQVFVVTTAALPESVRRSAIRLYVAHSFQKSGTMLANVIEGTRGDGFFHRVEKGGDIDC